MLLKIFFSLFKCMRAIVCFACLLAWRLVRAYILVHGDPKFIAEEKKEEANAEYLRAWNTNEPLPMRWGDEI